MGRSLTNTMINIGIQGACDEAMYQVYSVGHGVLDKRKTPVSGTSSQFHHSNFIHVLKVHLNCDILTLLPNLGIKTS